MFPQTEAAAAATDNVGEDVDEEYCSDLDYRIKQFHLYKGGDVADVYYLNGDRFTKYWDLFRTHENEIVSQTCYL